jgi:hypothetical protein
VSPFLDPFCGRHDVRYQITNEKQSALIATRASASTASPLMQWGMYPKQARKKVMLSFPSARTYENIEAAHQTLWIKRSKADVKAAVMLKVERLRQGRDG